MQVLFGTVDLDAHTWQVIVAVASSVFILVEIEKFFIRLFLPKAAAGNGMKWIKNILAAPISKEVTVFQ